MKGKGMISLLSSHHSGKRTKIRIASIGEENQERRERRG
jgi:ribosomal protein L20A (L18A)